MKALVVEDDTFKLEQISRTVRHELPDAELVIACSVKSAERALLGRVDFVILDMSLPSFDIRPGESGGRPRGFGGRAVLDFMKYADISVPAVVLTQFEQFIDGERVVDLAHLRKELLGEYAEILHDIIFFDGSSGSWQAALKNFIRSVPT